MRMRAQSAHFAVNGWPAKVSSGCGPRNPAIIICNVTVHGSNAKRRKHVWVLLLNRRSSSRVCCIEVCSYVSR